jgi:serine/threonine protein kinase
VKHRTFGRYEVLKRLGRGGMAEVYHAFDPTLARNVAIKVLHGFLSDESQFKTRFEREAQNIAKLKHPNIVQVYDFAFEPETDSYYMVMELIDGPTLKDYLQDETEDTGKLTLLQTIRIIRQAAEALSYAHQRGMIHRDVKTANLILDRQENDRIVLTDFGIAKIVTSSIHTTSGGLIGTPAYMAPEQGAGDPGDERSDLYSLGVIMFQLLTGQLPFDGETPMALILQHMNEPVPLVRATEPHLPPAVDIIMQKLLAKAPDDRYQTAQALLDDLDLLENTPARLDPTTLFIPQVAPPSVDDMKQTTSEIQQLQPARRRFPAAPLLLVIGLLVTIGGIYVAGAMNDIFPAAPLVGLLISETPVPTETSTATVTQSEVPASPTTDNTSQTAAALAVGEQPASPTAETPTATESPTRRPTLARTPTPTITPTNTATPNATQTAAAEQTLTTTACLFDYAIISEDVQGANPDGYFPTNREYQNSIRIQNTGTCTWEALGSLEFVSGENLRANRFTILEEVPVGEDTIIEFKGITPTVGGGTEPLTGRWQLKTKGQLPIGEPFEISVLVFDPGTTGNP